MIFEFSITPQFNKRAYSIPVGANFAKDISGGAYLLRKELETYSLVFENLESWSFYVSTKVTDSPVIDMFNGGVQVMGGFYKDDVNSPLAYMETFKADDVDSASRSLVFIGKAVPSNPHILLETTDLIMGAF